MAIRKLSKKKCKRGRRKGTRSCKRKPGPKKSLKKRSKKSLKKRSKKSLKKRSKKCKRGRRKGTRSCKRKPGPKKSHKMQREDYFKPIIDLSIPNLNDNSLPPGFYPTSSVAQQPEYSVPQQTEYSVPQSFPPGFYPITKTRRKLPRVPLRRRRYTAQFVQQPNYIQRPIIRSLDVRKGNKSGYQGPKRIVLQKGESSLCKGKEEVSCNYDPNCQWIKSSLNKKAHCKVNPYGYGNYQGPMPNEIMTEF